MNETTLINKINAISAKALVNPNHTTFVRMITDALDLLKDNSGKQLKNKPNEAFEITAELDIEIINMMVVHWLRVYANDTTGVPYEIAQPQLHELTAKYRFYLQGESIDWKAVIARIVWAYKTAFDKAQSHRNKVNSTSNT